MVTSVLSFSLEFLVVAGLLSLALFSVLLGPTTWRFWKQRHSKSITQGPPVLAEAIIYSTSSVKFRESILGDLDEMYYEDLKKFGRRSAAIRYWSQVPGFVLWFLKRASGITFIESAFSRKFVD